MHFTEEEQRKRERKQPKWSRWADDKLTDDEDSGSETCRRIVNETTVLGPVLKPTSNIVAMPTHVSSTRQDAPSSTSTADCRHPSYQESHNPPIMPRRVETSTADYRSLSYLESSTPPIIPRSVKVEDRSPSYLESCKPPITPRSVKVEDRSPSYLESCEPPIIPRSMEEDSDVLTVFCDDGIQDLMQDDIPPIRSDSVAGPVVSPRLEITALNTPVNRPNVESPPSQHDLRQTLKHRDLRFTLKQGHSPRQRFCRGQELRAAFSRDGPQREVLGHEREVSGQQIVVQHRPLRDDQRPEVIFSDCYRNEYLELTNRLHRFSPYNGPGMREPSRFNFPREVPRVNLHETCQASMQELVKQNGQLQSRLLELEQQHREVLHRSIEQSKFVTHTLTMLAENQRNLVTLLCHDEIMQRRVAETGNINRRLQQAVARHRRQQVDNYSPNAVFEEQLSFYYC